MSVEFSRMREFENQRVRMVFDDGLETVATLLSAVEDTDGDHHLIYENVEWANDPREFATAHDSSVYAEGASLISIDAAEPNWKVAIELHDSELFAIDPSGSDYGCVVLDAYVHRTQGEPGWSPGEGGVQTVRMTFSNMRVEGVIGELPAYLYDSSLRIGTEIHTNMVAFPARNDAPIRFEMMLGEDARTVVVYGDALTILADHGFRSVEHYDGHERPAT